MNLKLNQRKGMENPVRNSAGGSTRVSRVVSGVAPETYCGVESSKVLFISVIKFAQEQFGETPNWTRGTRVLHKVWESRSYCFASN